MAVVFLLYVVAEVAAVWAVASAIGLLPTLGLLLAGAIVGSWLARREGGKAARAFMATARSGRSPHAEVTDGMLVGLGGLLILLPGFVTDFAGLLLLLPPTRGFARRAWLRRIERKVPVSHRHYGGVIVVDSEVVREPGEPQAQPRRPVIDSE
ncbi:UPF0716 protein FxsA [Saccharomonospora amisosensis]|uniref:UPF0716 protein FxsA n=1 Tax=Saccharomonospora amisosensis TaxID=1128677 RepID=A0A7X5UWM7_9PSEU|nr:FxsA family protein [Saccharomonospora amisosensis]NIJ15029.1 UPF0716 protein FxsA [Saccharomonospora amisosensis]